MNDYGARRGGPRFSGDQRQPSAMVEQPMELPAQFVDTAEQVVLALGHPGYNGELQFYITTSKIRNLLNLVMEVYNQEFTRTGEELLPQSVQAIQMMRVRMLYEAGRDPNTKEFIQKSHLIGYMKDIGTSRKKLMDYTQYLEALVAYHRFFGGREN